ncbi:hypothetical protein [Vibrio hangzhouensis]|uniref:hypothetical protein n=1 Tax=Vibrio hangzhouensis TaxID=462991 RepID=UPI00135C5600|nr:hypothetical protein [Vibrio hangzhouensis]
MKTSPDPMWSVDLIITCQFLKDDVDLLSLVLNNWVIGKGLSLYCDHRADSGHALPDG